MATTNATKMLTSNSLYKRKKGFTLTEIAIVLGIVGLILGAVWSAAKNVYGNVNSTKAAEVTSVLIANIRGLYATQAPTAGDLSASFQQFSYPTSGATTLNPDVSAATNSSAIAGFIIAFDATDTTTVNGVTYGGAVLPNSSIGTAICHGIASATTSAGGSVASTSAALKAIPANGTCVASVCPTQAGYIGSACSAPTGTCSYSALNPCTGAGVPTVAAFIPWNP